MRYASAADFRRALLERLTNRSRAGAENVTRLMRQVAFERFLARLFRRGDEAWLLKGGYALELRLGTAARATRDLDLSIPVVTTDALETLRAAAAIDLGDHFAFTIEVVLEDMAGPPYGGSRHRVAARLAGRHPSELLVGEALDFWRVEVVERDRLLRLRAEMRVPGRAWLQFETTPDGDHSQLVQTALFEPKGLAGVLYWYLLYPLHRLIFRAMVRAVAREAERISEGEFGNGPGAARPAEWA